MEKPPPLAVAEDEERSTKKVKNRENEETMTKNEGDFPKSFKGTLMEGEDSMMIEMTNEKEIEVGVHDLSRSIKDNLTAIDFSDRVRKEMAEAMDNTIMPTKPITTPKQAFIGSPKIINGPDLVARTNFESPDVVCTSRRERVSTIVFSIVKRLSLNAPLPCLLRRCSLSAGNASRPRLLHRTTPHAVNASLRPVSSTRKRLSALGYDLIDFATFFFSRPTSANSLLVLPLPDLEAFDAHLLSTSRPSTSPRVDAAIRD
ncbi:hypothetical protein Scep_023141 [Stephania cephalantha]|uniref:Uncharacterized protein n=1 Tax=Stephania cephalantha TaxID=152367 RepID=A0AAP0EU57_9MAGN